MQLLASEEYGLRCLLRVASAEATQPVPISRIAKSEGLSPEYTAKLMRRLRQADLVTSVRGAEGGYCLARPATAISVWNALEALGGAFYSDEFCECHPGQARECVRSSNCALRAMWQTIQRTLRDSLQRISLADLCRDERSMLLWLEPSRDPQSLLA